MLVGLYLWSSLILQYESRFLGSEHHLFSHDMFEVLSKDLFSTWVAEVKSINRQFGGKRVYLYT